MRQTGFPIGFAFIEESSFSYRVKRERQYMNDFKFAMNEPHKKTTGFDFLAHPELWGWEDVLDFEQVKKTLAAYQHLVDDYNELPKSKRPLVTKIDTKDLPDNHLATWRATYLGESFFRESWSIAFLPVWAKSMHDQDIMNTHGQKMITNDAYTCNLKLMLYKDWHYDLPVGVIMNNDHGYDYYELGDGLDKMQLHYGQQEEILKSRFNNLEQLKKGLK